MTTRPSFSQTASNPRRREPSFPSPLTTRGSSTLAPSPTSTTGPWGTSSPAAPALAPVAQRKKTGPSLSLAFAPLSETGQTQGESGKAHIHPLKYNWDVWFSHRSAGAGAKGGKKEEAVKAAGKEKESREEWEGGVVRLGGFSSIESLHPFLAHLCPPSALPASIATTAALFATPLEDPSSDSYPNPTNVISDINIFRSPIAPLWEDPANAGGGRWVLRLRKGVADRVWEEVVFALVGERIGGEDDRSDGGGKVNGVVLSVRKDEDILSLWCAPSSRTERDIIRDSLRTALDPLLTATSSANLALDYKPHPVSHSAGGPTPNSRERPDAPPHSHSTTEHRTHRGDTSTPSRQTERSSRSNGTERSGGVRGGEGGGGGGFSGYSAQPRGESRHHDAEKAEYREGGGGERREYHTRGEGYAGGRPRRMSGAETTLERVGTALKESRSSAPGSWGRGQ